MTMKRLLIITVFFSLFTGLLAQESGLVLLNYNTLERKWEKSNEDIEHEKKGINPKTWMDRGELLQDIYNIDLEYLSEGTAKTELQLYYKDPLSVSTVQDADQPTEILEYERIKYFMVNDALSRWEKTKMVTDNPLDKAYEAFKKTLELDEKGKYTEDVKEELTQLKTMYKQSGINSYYSNNYKEALHDFEMVLKINEMDMFEGEIDTIMVQYSGIIAREIEDYEKAAEYYTKLTEINFGGPSTFLNVKNDYLAMEDSARAIEIMEKAFDKYPDTLNVVANLVDLYIRTNNIQKGLGKVNQAIDNNPDKGELYYWKGRLLLNTEDEDRIDQALEVYEKAIEKNPTLYYVYYDIGFIYFLQGQDIFNQAGQERDAERRKQINEIATEKYEEAIPMMKKSLELNESNTDIKKETLDILKRIYYKLGMDDAYNEVTNELNNL